MLTYEYKIQGSLQQYAAIDEAIRVVQFIRNKCLSKWMDEVGVSSHDLQCYCAVLANAYLFASRLNSQARQVAADRAWSAIQRFFENCKNHTPGKKGYPRFQHDNRSVEYKTTGWKFEPDGKHLRFTDGCGIGRLRLIGNKKQRVFLDWVRYYGLIHDVPFVAVAPHFTSQNCSGCGKIVKKSLSERTHRCLQCGLMMDRDENAARNILAKALAWLMEVYHKKNKAVPRGTRKQVSPRGDETLLDRRPLPPISNEWMASPLDERGTPAP